MTRRDISKYELAKIIAEYDKGTFFSVEFIKRTTNEVRKMTCRKGVHKYTKGVGLLYDPKEHNLCGVWIANGPGKEESYRMINLETLISAEINGVSYKVKEED